MKGTVIGALGIFHVSLAPDGDRRPECSCVIAPEWLERTWPEPQRRAGFINGYLEPWVLVSFVLGALAGVATWFTSIQVSLAHESA